MKQQRAPFMPVTPDIDDDALENLARDKGVGALVKPVANRAGEGPPTVVASTPVPATQQPADATEHGAASVPTPRSRMKAVNLELPDYAWTELKIRAAKEQVSVRHIIMTALKQHGIEIAESDMIEDGRRLRN